MSVDIKHPLYEQHIDDWLQQRDLYDGERVVKLKREKYLPATIGMHLDGMGSGGLGQIAYDNYLNRAIFPDYIKEAVEGFIGLLHQKDAVIELPALMEPLRERATPMGESLTMLLRRINSEQLITGRVGLLADMPASETIENGLPYIVTYGAESIINWDEAYSFGNPTALNLVVLDESRHVRVNNFEWENLKQYRVLQLGDLQANELEGEGYTYSMGVFTADDKGDVNYDNGQMIIPLYKGTSLQKIPFVFINTRDIVANPDNPPLMGLGRLSLAIYRGEADYRQSLFMQGQDTLVVVGGVNTIGDDDALRTGAGSRIDVDMGGDAKYIGVSSSGLSEQRLALENDRKRAESKSGQLISVGANNRESGEALKTRITAQTATLNQIALAGAAGLENLLKTIATWVGADENEVRVIPNLEFADYEVNGQDIVHLMTARSMGAPISKQSVHNILTERGITKLDYESEIELIGEEDAGTPFITDDN